MGLWKFHVDGKLDAVVADTIERAWRNIRTKYPNSVLIVAELGDCQQ